VVVGEEEPVMWCPSTTRGAATYFHPNCVHKAPDVSRGGRCVAVIQYAFDKAAPPDFFEPDVLSASEIDAAKGFV
jgi:hypothetical protein